MNGKGEIRRFLFVREMQTTTSRTGQRKEKDERKIKYPHNARSYYEIEECWFWRSLQKASIPSLFMGERIISSVRCSLFSCEFGTNGPQCLKEEGATSNGGDHSRRSQHLWVGSLLVEDARREVCHGH